MLFRKSKRSKSVGDYRIHLAQKRPGSMPPIPNKPFLGGEALIASLGDWGAGVQISPLRPMKSRVCILHVSADFLAMSRCCLSMMCRQVSLAEPLLTYH